MDAPLPDIQAVADAALAALQSHFAGASKSVVLPALVGDMRHLHAGFNLSVADRLERHIVLAMAGLAEHLGDAPLAFVPLDLPAGYQAARADSAAMSVRVVAGWHTDGVAVRIDTLTSPLPPS